ncbi:MAG: LCP family protein [Butyrivibrio sp.]|nr:LCP family protein [Muribaculum sp.]MCM1551602.1 LCP family protein [Butyrivibrio sp.]
MAQNSERAAGTRQKAARGKSKVIIFAIEIFLILIMLAVLFYVMTRDESGPYRAQELNPDDLINEEVLNKNQGGENTPVVEPGVMVDTGYMNIALFGVDATTESGIFKGSNSDSIMIASIDMDTGDIKLVSVYRDTFLNVGTDEYRKCNYAYQAGGAPQAIKMLNMNLDMDITNFITVNYHALIDLVDGLGGIYIDVDNNELKHINNYQITIDKDLKLGGYTPVKETGYQKLNGLQVAAYCRIRYNVPGGDFGRASNQREVIKAIEEQAKKTDSVTLLSVFNKVIEEVYTSIDNKDLMELVTNIGNYRIVEEGGFPEETMRTTGNIGAKGDCVVPMDLESNVVWLHQFLFDDEDYAVSGTVKEYSQSIKSKTSAYLNR